MPTITFTPQTVKKYRQLDSRLQAMLIDNISAIVKAEKKDIADALWDTNPECLYDSPMFSSNVVKIKNNGNLTFFAKLLEKNSRNNTTLLNIL